MWLKITNLENSLSPELIDRLHWDRTLRVLCGWRYRDDIPSEATFR